MEKAPPRLRRGGAYFMKPSKKWRKIQPIYRYFAGECEKFDFSEEAACEMFVWETQGKGNLKLGLFTEDDGKLNGYAVGKHWMDATIGMWNEDILTGVLFIDELYEDQEFKEWHWWLDKVLNPKWDKYIDEKIKSAK